VGILLGYDLFLLLIADFAAISVFIVIASIASSGNRDSEKELQPQEYAGLSMPVCPACIASTISRKKLTHMAFGGLGLIMLPFIILLSAGGNFNFIVVLAVLSSFILGVILFIRAFSYSKGLRSLTIWKHENRYLWVIPNIKFAKEFALLNGFKDRNTM